MRCSIATDKGEQAVGEYDTSGGCGKASSITRRQFLTRSGMVATALVTAGSWNTAAQAQDRRAPNVVLVLADDLGIGDLIPYGGALINTPAIERLSARGMTSDAMYAAASTDTPSRGGLLVGRHGARYGLPASITPDAKTGLPATAQTVAALLQNAGYATGLFGQWRLGAQDKEQPLDHGFETFAGTLYGTDVDSLDWYEGREVAEASFEPAQATRRITEETITFVNQHRNEPFFAVLSHLAPHAPFAAEARFAGRSRAGAYGDTVEQIDYYLGLLLDHLERTGLAERTLVILTSDNGPRYEGSNQRRRGRKPEVFDGGVRVPFIASWPTVTRSARDSVPRSLLDITPSLCTLAGVEPPSELDGEDLSPLLSGDSPPERGPVYLFYDEWLNAMRSGRWKLHVAFEDKQRDYMPQLFDLGADFREAYNVAKLHPEVVEGLRNQLEEVREDVASEAPSATREVNR